ncbi:hypothetical protein L2E82_47858 [Cichorium intybus]|uniref:Uncharacterized protein n=1 Tax=Cichorium intybus TaxID=13427 RepID=A0ACB8YX55_CICIN|nr:hypothetical protein L2E82_47858 [Cichorium intybus]
MPSTSHAMLDSRTTHHQERRQTKAHSERKRQQKCFRERNEGIKGILKLLSGHFHISCIFELKKEEFASITVVVFRSVFCNGGLTVSGFSLSWLSLYFVVKARFNSVQLLSISINTLVMWKKFTILVV